MGTAIKPRWLSYAEHGIPQMRTRPSDAVDKIDAKDVKLPEKTQSTEDSSVKNKGFLA